MRILLYTGKGGVGKTTLAAATALRASRLGYKTMVFSTDIAHSLADSFDIPFSGEPRELAPNLWGQEMDIYRELNAYWGTIQRWLSALLTWRGLDDIVAEELAVLPGMEELASLLYVADYYAKESYDLMVVDCAPTGETLRLLSFPEIARWYMEKVFPIEKRVIPLVRPFVRRVANVPIPTREIFDAIEDLYHRLEQMRLILTDPEVTSIRLVVNPEKMVIKEAQRTYTYLNLFNYATDLILCNRVIPRQVRDRYFVSWKEQQEKYYQLIEESFAPIPIRSAPLMEREVVGLEMLQAIGDATFGDEDPAKHFFRGHARAITKEDGYYLFTLALPFTEKESLSLLRSGDELIIQAGNRRRNVVLPRTLVGKKVLEARFQGDRLLIKFQEGKNDRKDV